METLKPRKVKVTFDIQAAIKYFVKIPRYAVSAMFYILGEANETEDGLIVITPENKENMSRALGFSYVMSNKALRALSSANIFIRYSPHIYRLNEELFVREEE